MGIKKNTTEVNLSYQYYSNQVLNFEDSQKELKLLISLAKIMRADFDEQQVLKYFLDAVLDLCHWSVGHIYFVDIDEEGESLLIPSNIWSMIDESKYVTFRDHTMMSDFKNKKSLPGTVLTLKKSCWIEDIFSVTKLKRAQVGISCGLHGAFGIPVYKHGHIYAIAEFFSSSPHEKDQSMLHIADIAAILLSSMLERKEIELELNLKLTELKNTQSELVQNSKMASLGQLSAGIAHEINNPIAYVHNNIDLIKDFLDRYSKFHSQLKQLFMEGSENKIKELVSLKDCFETLKLDKMGEFLEPLCNDSLEGLLRVKEIVQGLRYFSHGDSTEKTKVRLNECLDVAIKITQAQIKNRIEITNKFTDQIEVMGYTGPLIQVFTNLIINASQAIKDKGSIEVDYKVVDNRVSVFIKDTGEGIPEHMLDKIFDPFFTTKAVGKGTGLGLSISYRIIENHSGKISVESKVGEGTIFRVDLPVVT